MEHLKDMRLSRLGAAVLALVSLIATLVILAGGGGKGNVVLAAEAGLKHRPQAVQEVQPPAQTVTVASPSASGDLTPPASDPGSSSTGTDSGSGDAGSDSSSGSTDAGASSTSGAKADAASTTTTGATTTATDAGLPKVGHVFLLPISTTDYAAAFGTKSAAPYLRSLLRRGTVLSGYHALGSRALPDLLAMLSGQPPNQDTSAGCSSYSPFPASTTLNTAGIAKGSGCIYPDAALTVADQVTAAGKSWGAYVDGVGTNNCPVPNSGESADTPLDGTEAGYDVTHNPFAFFGSLLDTGGCSEYDQALGNLPKALAKKSATPELTYVSGNACVDADPTLAPAVAGTTTTTPADTGTGTGTDGTVTTTPAATTTAAAATTTAAATTAPAATTTAVDATTTAADATTTSALLARLTAPAAYGCPAGDPSGMAAEDAFLKTWVPQILRSAAYRADGVLVIALTGAGGKSTADTGALVLSRWTPKGKRVKKAYTAYSLLHSVEDMLNLAPLAKAAHAPAFARLVLG